MLRIEGSGQDAGIRTHGHFLWALELSNPGLDGASQVRDWVSSSTTKYLKLAEMFSFNVCRFEAQRLFCKREILDSKMGVRMFVGIPAST